MNFESTKITLAILILNTVMLRCLSPHVSPGEEVMGLSFALMVVSMDEICTRKKIRAKQ